MTYVHVLDAPKCSNRIPHGEFPGRIAGGGQELRATNGSPGDLLRTNLGVSVNMGIPQNRWFEIPRNMDDNQGYPYDLGNLQRFPKS